MIRLRNMAGHSGLCWLGRYALPAVTILAALTFLSNGASAQQPSDSGRLSTGGTQTSKGALQRNVSDRLVVVDGTGVPLPGRICYQSGFCWDHPRLQGEDLYAVWAAGQKEVWAVGRSGTALRFSKGAWRKVATGTLDDLVAVWGPRADDVWMLGRSGGLFRWDGHRILTSVLTPEEGSPNITTGPQQPRVDDIPVVKVDDPAMAGIESPAREWPEGMRAHFRGLWGSGKGHVWVVGGARHLPQGPADENEATVAIVRRFDGKAWTSHVDRTKPPLDSVWGRDSSDVWALVDDPRLYWNRESRIGKLRELALHWNGRRWQSQPSVPINWLSGGMAHFGTVAMLDNPKWPDSGPRYLRSVAGLGDADAVGAVWGSGQAGLWLISGNNRIIAMQAAEEDGASAQGPKRVWQGHLFEGALDLFGSSERDVWLVGRNGMLLHYDGETWSGANTSSGEKPKDLLGVWADGEEAWAVGDQGMILRRTRGDSEWRAISSPSKERLYGVWGTSSDALWVVGNFGVILKCSKNTCREVRKPSHQPGSAPLYAVAGLGANDVWAVGRGGAGVHWNGVEWATQPLPTRDDVRQIEAGSGELWIPGGYRWDGRTWSPEVFQAVPGNAKVTAIHPAGPGHYWIQGSGFIGRAVGRKIVELQPLAHGYHTACILGPKEIWLVDRLGSLHGVDGRWTYHSEVSLPLGESGPVESLFGACATANGTAWVVGDNGRILVWRNENRNQE
jgi:photosystem II stability/assembly factor-like uncharacterized protein